MLENRSFDHMLGYSGIENVEGVGDKQLSNQDKSGSVHHVECNAAAVAELRDPGHDYDDVYRQMFYRPEEKDRGATEPTMLGGSLSPTGVTAMTRERCCSGGLYDHVPPPVAPQPWPGDVAKNQPDPPLPPFHFDRYGHPLAGRGRL